MDSIAKTSLLTAAMRALESKRSDSEGRLFSDPYAEILAGDEGVALMQRGIAEVGDQPAIAVRTSFMDQKINEALNNGVQQIVMLAAGMDTRTYRLSLPNGTQIYELDRPEVLNYKKEKLKNTKPNCTLHSLPADLKNPWSAILKSAGFTQGKKTLWLVEGLLMYLEEPDALILFERINSISSSKDILLCDIFSQALLQAPHMKKQLQFLESMGAPWKFGIKNEPELFFKNMGWSATAIQPGEFLPSRWPFPVAPRNIPNVPRSFFVEAHKI